MRFALAIFAVCVLALPAHADAVRGKYTYNTAFTINLTAPAKAQTADTDKGTLTVIARGSDLKFIWSSDEYVCKLTAKLLAGDVIRFTRGQSCTIEDDVTDTVLTLTLARGSGSVDEDDELDLTFDWRISGYSQGHELAGRANQRTTAIPF